MPCDHCMLGMSFIIQHRKCIKFSTAKQTQIPLLISALNPVQQLTALQYNLHSIRFWVVGCSVAWILSGCILECDEARCWNENYRIVIICCRDKYSRFSYLIESIVRQSRRYINWNKLCKRKLLLSRDILIGLPKRYFFSLFFLLRNGFLLFFVALVFFFVPSKRSIRYVPKFLGRIDANSSRINNVWYE